MQKCPIHLETNGDRKCRQVELSPSRPQSHGKLMLNVYIIVPGGVYLVSKESPIRPFSRFPSLVLSSRTIPRLSGNFPADRINAYRAQLLRTTPEQTPKNLA